MRQPKKWIEKIGKLILTRIRLKMIGQHGPMTFLRMTARLAIKYRKCSQSLSLLKKYRNHHLVDHRLKSRKKLIMPGKVSKHSKMKQKIKQNL